MLMIDESHTESIFLTSVPRGDFFLGFIRKIGGRWPRACGEIDLYSANPTEFHDISKVSEAILREAWGVTVFRDPDMRDTWDWGVKTSEAFDGEGPIGLYCSLRHAPSLIDFRAIVIWDFTDQEKQNREIRILGNAILLEVVLPDDPQNCPFSEEMLNLVRAFLVENNGRVDILENDSNG